MNSKFILLLIVIIVCTQLLLHQFYFGAIFILCTLILLYFENNLLQIRNNAIGAAEKITKNLFEFPPKVLLNLKKIKIEGNQSALKKARLIVKTYKKFGIKINYSGANKSPTVTQLLFTIDNEDINEKNAATKVAKILQYRDDIKQILKTNRVNFIPIVEGTNCFGIEVANDKNNSAVGLLNIIISDKFQEFIKNFRIKDFTNGLPIALGLDINGEPLFINLVQAPHLLIAGSTNSGKTSCIHAIINSLVFYHHPKTLKLFLVDGKTNELNFYTQLPHLGKPIITTFDDTNVMLDEVFTEVERRNEILKNSQKRNIISYNETAKNPLPFIVIIIDEYAEITMQTKKSSEMFENFQNKIVRIGQLARSAGVHLILSTQRPDKNIVTPLLKANIPTRISFQVTDKTNSMVVLDKIGAELLTGKGDGFLLFNSHLTRFQCTFVEDIEILNVVKWWDEHKG